MSQNISIKINPGSAALAGNPISAHISITDDSGEAKTYFKIDFEINSEDVVIYSGTATTDAEGKIRLNLAEIFEEEIKAPDYKYSQMVISPRQDLLKNWSITVMTGTEIVTKCGPATYFGRISNRMLRYLNERNSNIFTYKFLNKKGNFLLQTRSAKKHFFLYRSEITPLYFIAAEDEIYVNDENGEGDRLDNLVYLRPYQIDLPALTSDYPGTTWSIGKDPDCIDINILEDPAAQDLTLFEYRNAFGVRERLLCTGEKDKTFDVTDNEIFFYDQDYDVISPVSTTPEHQHKFNVNTGYLTPERINALQAMILSDEVYIVRENFLEPVQVKCQTSIPCRVKEPMNFVLEVLSVGQDKGFIPDLISEDYGDPRIHNDLYNDNYN